eukprot:TRINITY_DN21570_c0_g1_i1.p1 TRINITY_DN21570_c0_g1~~TRINITY_DN21570_c0_g1_i1.p1  ORF type:complete len:297 (-),score=24.52 TRINITY_DN21570_c0_g1_i1:43-897(-)
MTVASAMEAWLSTALLAARRAGIAGKELRVAQWQIFEVSKSFMSGSRTPAEQGILELYEVTKSAGEVSELKRELRSSGRNDLANIVNKASITRHFLAHPRREKEKEVTAFIEQKRGDQKKFRGDWHEHNEMSQLASRTLAEPMPSDGDAKKFFAKEPTARSPKQVLPGGTHKDVCSQTDGRIDETLDVATQWEPISSFREVAVHAASYEIEADILDANTPAEIHEQWEKRVSAHRVRYPGGQLPSELRSLETYQTNRVKHMDFVGRMAHREKLRFRTCGHSPDL